MNFRFATAADHNGRKSGIIKEGAINELGEVAYTKDERFDDGHYPTFEEIVANEVLRRIYGSPVPSKEKLKNEAFDRSREAYGLQKHRIESANKSAVNETANKPTNETPERDVKRQPTNKDSLEKPVKIGVNIKELNDDEFIEYTKRRVQSNRDFERFKAIKSKIRSTLEGRTHNEKAFDMFVKLHDIDKRGFFNRSAEDDKLIGDAIKLYGSV